MTIVFADLVRSTELSEQLDPEALRSVLSYYFDRMKALVHHHGGLVEKFIGDAVVAVFGIPQMHEDDALRAVRAADAMRLTMRDLNRDFESSYGLRLANRIGVSTGEVVTGGPTGMDMLATGNAMNVAARLQQTAEPGEVLLSSETYRLVRAAVIVAPAQLLQFKGLQGDVQVFRLIGVASPDASRGPLLESPLIGRDDELGALNSALMRVRQQHRCRLITILGDAGVGKSRLAHEFVQGQQDHCAVLRGRCLPYGQGITFWAFGQVVRQAAGIEERDSSTAGWAKLRSLLDGHPDADVISERVAEVIGLRQAAAIPEETFWSARKLLEIVARDRPLIVVFDDIHWAEPTFLRLLDHLLEWTQRASILMICMARRELVEAHPEWPAEGYDRPPLVLEHLTDDQCRVLLTNLVGRSQAVQTTIERVVVAAEGNPLFVEQLVLMLIDEGVLQQHDRVWSTTEIDRLDLPTSIQALLGARLHQLKAVERDALERGAVEGRIFHQGAVMELVDPESRDGVPDTLQTLVRRQLLGPERGELAGEQAYRFKHLLIRDTAYRGIPKKLRATWHEHFADWLERMLSDRIVEYEEIMGYHLERAYFYGTEIKASDPGVGRVAERASEHLSLAGRRALARGDASGAVNLLDRACRLSRAGSVPRVELLLDLSTALMDAGSYADAERTLKEAIRLSRESGDQALQAHARIQLARLGMQATPEGATANAMLELESAIPVLAESGDILGLARSFLLQAEVHNMRGQALAMEEALNNALVNARKVGARREQGQCLWWLALISYFGPRPTSEVARRLPQILAESEGDRLVKAIVLFVEAGLESMAGRVSEARAALTTGKDILLDLGLRVVAAATLAASGIPFEVEVAAGDPAAAEREERYGYEILHAIRERSSLPTSAAYLADAVYLQARYDEAQSLAEISMATAARDDLLAQIQWRSIRAKVLARKGESEAALMLAEEATKLADDTDYLFAKARALMDKAEVLQLTDQPLAAVQAITRAIEIYQQKEDLLGVARAQLKMQQLDQSDQ